MNFLIETMNACDSIIIQNFEHKIKIRDFIYLIKLNLTITIFFELKTCPLRHESGVVSKSSVSEIED